MACVLQCSVSPFERAQSNTMRGVSVTACSFRLEMVCINDIYGDGVPVHVGGGKRKCIVAKPGILVDSASCALLVRGRLGLHLHLRPEYADHPGRDFDAKHNRRCRRIAAAGDADSGPGWTGGR